jgi:cytochrome P450
MRTAIEEVLRWTAPSLNVMRTARTAARIGGVTVEAGERVSVWNPIANRDPEAFPAPDVFDVWRSPNNHLTFGVGTHHCIGATLARMELRILLQELCRWVAEIQIVGPIKRLRSNLMWGIDSLPVLFRFEAEAG